MDFSMRAPSTLYNVMKDCCDRIKEHTDTHVPIQQEYIDRQRRIMENVLEEMNSRLTNKR